MRIILGLLLVLFLPGYSLIAARFPENGGIERIALSFGLSIAVVSLSGMALNYMPFGIRLVPIIVVRSVFTILLALVACMRRAGVSEVERFVVKGGAGVWAEVIAVAKAAGMVGWRERVWCGAEHYAKFKNKEL